MGTYWIKCPHCNKDFGSRKIIEELDAEYSRGREEGSLENSKASEQLEAYLQLNVARQRVFSNKGTNMDDIQTTPIQKDPVSLAMAEAHLPPAIVEENADGCNIRVSDQEGEGHPVQIQTVFIQAEEDLTGTPVVM